MPPHVQQSTQKAKEKSKELSEQAKAAAEKAEQQAKVVAQGVKEGWSRDERRVDLNSASEAQLRDLPGVGEHQAQRINRGPSIQDSSRTRGQRYPYGRRVPGSKELGHGKLTPS
jgi:hypothetical protein